MNPYDYLGRYGYLSQLTFRGAINSTQALLDENSSEVREAILDFQDMAGLQQTGTLDAATLRQMAMPRCGVKDRGAMELRARRYVTQGSRWPTNRPITYFVGSYPTTSLLSSAEVDKVIVQAFSLWSSAAEIDFAPASSSSDADIQLDFFAGRHLSDDPFDGRGGVLAHAFFPRFGGDIHFDDAEEWLTRKDVSRVRRGAKQLLQTATHEIGHSLGLQHSRDRDAIMAPFYRDWMDEMALRTDDISGIRSLYGRRSTFVTKPTVVKSTTAEPPSVKPSTSFKPTVIIRPDSDDRNPDDDLCANPSFDAATETADGSFYVFRGSQHWKLLSSGAAGTQRGFPRPNTDWSGLPGSVDAAFFNPAGGGYTYIFQGALVGKYRDQRIEPGYPRAIVDEFPGAPEADLDAALLWGKNRQVYFFRGSLYWKFNLDKGRVEDSYPRQIARGWRGVPGGGLSAALRWVNGKSYFFVGTEYYRFDDDSLAVDQMSRVRYPRTVGKWWLGCNTKEDEQDKATRTPRKVWLWSD